MSERYYPRGRADRHQPLSRAIVITVALVVPVVVVVLAATLTGPVTSWERDRVLPALGVLPGSVPVAAPWVTCGATVAVLLVFVFRRRDPRWLLASGGALAAVLLGEAARLLTIVALWQRWPGAAAALAGGVPAQLLSLLVFLLAYVAALAVLLASRRGQASCWVQTSAATAASEASSIAAPAAHAETSTNSRS